MRRQKLHLLAALSAMSLLAGAECRAEAPLGVAPRYTEPRTTPFANERAARTLIWIPGIDSGYVPQGVVFAESRLLISGYHSTDSKQNRGPCRLYAVSTASGSIHGHLDLPESCGHAGGLALMPSGRLLVSDTRVIFEVELSFGESETIGRVVRSVRLRGAVKGSFAAAEADGFWLGQYERAEPARMFKFAWSALEKKEISEADAIETVSIPVFAQGAAFDGAGALWIMRSGSKLGELVKLNRKTGAVAARFDMPVGTEGISFAPHGTLWTLSEAGSQRWSKWGAFYPVAFQFDMKLLK